MKMSNRHRLALILIIATTVSVFFAFCLSSCGIPTYWQPKNSTVITNTRSSGTVSFNVNVTYYSGDDGSNAPKIGLVLLYVYSDEAYSSAFETELVKTFNSDYRGSIPNGLSALECENNTAVWDFTVDSTTYNVYAFTDASSNAICAPYYNKDISSNTDISKSFTLKLNSEVSGVELYVDESSAVDSSFSFGLDGDNLEALRNSNYMHVYAAISAQGENYSNIYWSNLTYVGSFLLNNN